jgi:hypothetical protein
MEKELSKDLYIIHDIDYDDWQDNVFKYSGRFYDHSCDGQDQKLVINPRELLFVRERIDYPTNRKWKCRVYKTDGCCVTIKYTTHRYCTMLDWFSVGAV